MLKSFKYRLYPTDNQKVLLTKHFGHCRWVYNWALTTKQNTYKESKIKLSKFDLINMLPNLKKQKETEWLKEVDSQALQATVANMDTAYQRFFKKISAFPNFKSKHDSKQSYTVPALTKVDFNHGLVFIPKFREGIKCKFDRTFSGTIKKSTVSKNSCGQYFISILVDTGIDNPTKPVLVTKEDILGIDVGLTHFCITSTGEFVDNPRFLKSKTRRLTLLQRKLSHKQKGSKNRIKAKLKVAKLHQTIINKRTDFLHKLSTKLICDNQAVARENLNVTGMMKNHKLAKAISDVSWAEFDRQLAYKAEWSGKHFLKIGMFEASSKTCNCCGYHNKEMTLADREIKCPSCGAEYNRDINASKNIRDWTFDKYIKESVPTGGGEVKSVRRKRDIQRKSKRDVVDEVSVGQKEVS
jgi:putative transposase